MLRVRWFRLLLSVLCFLEFSIWASSAIGECWYNDEIHAEGTEVVTPEPCLNCTCSKGALLCYLRVCPTLPNPPPVGCILLHRYQTCCQELICSDIFESGNGVEARSEPDVLENQTTTNACVANGSIYGPGSAMDSSSLCEYCYCLGGKQICVKPKCLLSIEGCEPIYEPTNCCPVHYNCSYKGAITSSTTTMESIETEKNEDGCIVDGVYYKEGGKVLGVGHSVCDNCYCLRGILRCEPLSCAPPLFGCTPVVRPGQCCAASYNCSGTIEIQPEPNYGKFPIISKDYAKLHKEIQQKLFVRENVKNSGVKEYSKIPVYLLPQLSQKTKIERNPDSFGTTRHFVYPSFDSSTLVPFLHNSVTSETLPSTADEHFTQISTDGNRANIYYITKNYDLQNTNSEESYSNTPRNTELKTENTTNFIGDIENSFTRLDESIIISLLDDRLNRKVISAEKNIIPQDKITLLQETSTTENVQTTFDDFTSNEELSTANTINSTDLWTSEDRTLTESTNTPSETTLYVVTMQTILNSTDCINANDNLQKSHDLDNNEVTTIQPIVVDLSKREELSDVLKYDMDTISSDPSNTATTTTTVGYSVDLDVETTVKNVNLTFKNASKLTLEEETIYNVSKIKNSDYEYDYNEPSLPPSLPNLRIIPFVAADALDSQNTEHNIYDSKERETDLPSLGYNLFAPPIETEGGFVPKQSPILGNFYENTITSTSTTNSPLSHKANCINDDLEIIHGASVVSKSPCNMCSCFYGNIICQKILCPTPKLDCRKSPEQDPSSCCPHYICDDEISATMLDHLGGTFNSQNGVTKTEIVNSPNLFNKDVIRTKPAPDLQSLIVDMMPFLTQRTTVIPPTTISTAASEDILTSENRNTINEHFNISNDSSADRVLNLLFLKRNDHDMKQTDHNSELHTTSHMFPADSKRKVQSTTPFTFTTTNAEHVTKEDSSRDKNTVNLSSPGMAMLKLAGCNIYGRMYRVGRIISELSNPCLECKCTETGVQCRALNCST